MHRGNVIWNGGASKPLGTGDNSACQDSNPTCNTAQLLADNVINRQGVEPKLVNPGATIASANFR